MIGLIVACRTLGSICNTACPPRWISPRIGGLSFSCVPRPGALLRQTIALSGEMEQLDEDALRFEGPQPRERLTVTAGKFSVWDIFDRNRYSHDARTQF